MKSISYSSFVEKGSERRKDDERKVYLSSDIRYDNRPVSQDIYLFMLLPLMALLSNSFEKGIIVPLTETHSYSFNTDKRHSVSLLLPLLASLSNSFEKGIIVLLTETHGYSFNTDTRHSVSPSLPLLASLSNSLEKGIIVLLTKTHAYSLNTDNRHKRQTPQLL